VQDKTGKSYYEVINKSFSAEKCFKQATHFRLYFGYRRSFFLIVRSIEKAMLERFSKALDDFFRLTISDQGMKCVWLG